MPPDAEQEWLEPADVWRQLGYRSKKALYSAIERGQIRIQRRGRKLFFHRSWLKDPSPQEDERNADTEDKK